jgi:hypothetical protein
MRNRDASGDYEPGVQIAQAWKVPPVPPLTSLYLARHPVGLACGFADGIG